MNAATTSPLSNLSRRVLQLQIIALIWMSAEPAVSLGTAWSSRSPALFAFGGGSLIELLSAAVVFSRFRFELNEARAARIAGALLFILAAVAVLTSVLNFVGYREAQPSLPRDCNFVSRLSCNAAAREAKTAVGRHYFERCPEG